MYKYLMALAFLLYGYVHAYAATTAAPDAPTEVAAQHVVIRALTDFAHAVEEEGRFNLQMITRELGNPFLLFEGVLLSITAINHPTIALGGGALLVSDPFLRVIGDSYRKHYRPSLFTTVGSQILNFVGGFSILWSIPEWLKGNYQLTFIGCSALAVNVLDGLLVNYKDMSKSLWAFTLQNLREMNMVNPFMLIVGLGVFVMLDLLYTNNL